jgi:hypothetical protein
MTADAATSTKAEGFVPITATVTQFRRLSGLGKTKIFEMLKEGELQSVRIGRRGLVMMDSYRDLLSRSGGRP